VSISLGNVEFIIRSKIKLQKVCVRRVPRRPTFDQKALQVVG